MFSFLRSKFTREGLASLLVRLHRDEQGAEGLEKLLIIAAFVLPLLGLLMWYSDDMSKWVVDIWNRRKDESAANDFGVGQDPTN